MEIKAYVCPQCGASLDVEQDTTFTYCPNCGSKLHISYGGEPAPKPSDLRQFVAADTNVRIATAIVPEGYELSGALSNEWQSDFVPYTSVIHAVNKAAGITMISASREMFSDYCTPVVKGLIKLSTTVIRSSLKDFEEPEDYLTAWASKMTGLALTPSAKAALPSGFAKNLDREASLLFGEFQQAARLEASVGYQLVNLSCEPLLIKYHAKSEQGEQVVLCGGDFYGYEVSTGMFHLPEGVSEYMDKAVSGIKDVFSGMGTSMSGMTFNDWMHGGLLGKKLRERKEMQQNQAQAQPMQAAMDSSQAQPVQGQTGNSQAKHKELPPDGRIPLGHGREYGKPTDIIVWGSKRRYLMATPAEKEEEATKAFLSFVGSVQTDEGLEQQAAQMIAGRMQQIAQVNSQLQMQAQMKQMQTRQMQMQTSQMIARNAQHTSDGLMDSWNKRQAAQDRMSANYSEAIRGVDSYVTPMGGTVEMSVGADHVYQNQYGDTIGVSGNAVDPELANRLNWTELEKK